MREVDRKKTQNNNNQKKQQHHTPRQRDNNNKPATDNSGRAPPTRKETKSRNAASKANNKSKPTTAKSAINAKTGDPPSVQETPDVKQHHDDDDVCKSEDGAQDVVTGKGEKDDDDASYNKPTELERDEEEDSDSDTETADDTASSTGCDSQVGAGEEEELKEASNKVVEQKQHSNGIASRAKACYLDENKSELKWVKKSDSATCLQDEHKSEEEVFDEMSLDDEKITGRGNHEVEVCSVTDPPNQEDTEAAVNDDKILEQQMEEKIVQLEDELREVAALETSLYSVVPEHGSSAHKLHTPARRLSRLYIHACKHWTQSKRANIARSIVSGLVLVARTCGSDVSRLTYWLSNTVVLREMISQAFGGNSRQMMSSVKLAELTKSGQKSSPSSSGNLNQLVEDWQETRTFTAALERIESWIFLRIVDSIWWQIFAPNMQCPDEDSTIRPSSECEDRGSFSTDLWKNAFQDAFRRLCPVRAGGNDCGCLSVLARMVMEQSIGRLDVAMFNAILRESASQIPTDPVSDPILDPSVLPIPAGDLSFGSGAQLKNSVGNWSRWLSDTLGMETGYQPTDNNQSDGEEDDNQKARRTSPQKRFRLLDELSDLLMLPKDMLLDRSVRKEVCPSITLPLIKRVLCNFSPDEFCPDDVPGEVLEALNAESVVERRLSIADPKSSSFPYTASPIVYSLPSLPVAAEKLAQIGGNGQLGRVQSKDYASDDELNDLSLPLASIMTGQNQEALGEIGFGQNFRYKLLQEVWSV